MALSAREAALRLLYEVEENQSYANLQTSKLLTAGDYRPQEARLITDLVSGVIRQQQALDYLLGKLLSKPLSGLPLWILLILRVSL